MSYTRTTTLDPNPGGDTTKGAIVDKLDVDLSGIFTHLTNHEAAVAAVHGATGAIVDTSSAQTITAKTISSCTITGGTIVNTSFSLTNSLAVTQGGTGLATLTDHGILLGSGTDDITPLGAATNGQIPIGSTGADPVLATITATANETTVANAAGSITIGIADDVIVPTTITIPNTGLHVLDTNASHDLIIKPGSDITADRTLTITTGDADRTVTLSANLTVESTSLVNQDLTSDASPTFNALTLSTDLTVANGGTGASTLTDHGILLGSGTDAITPLGAATNGQLPIGSTGADPVLATLTAGVGIDITNAAGSITITSDAATAGDYLQIADDSEAMSDAGSTTYTKKKEIRVAHTGTYRVKFTLAYGGTGSPAAYGKIYKNGVAFGTEQSLAYPAATPAVKSEDLAFTAADLVQLYIKTNGSDAVATVSKFRLFSGVALVPCVQPSDLY